MKPRNENGRNHSRQPPRPKMFGISLPQTPQLFNLIRSCLFSTIILWTVICMAIAVHFQGLLAASDLTRFVPFAIFVCSASLVIFLTLLAFTIFRRENSPISTRIELGCLGLAGTLWLALGAFLVNSESESADVECFASATDTQPMDNPGFSTDTYRAQYHVLEAFSLFNVILIWGFLLLLLGLALRMHIRGKKSVWYNPVTTYNWFRPNSGGKLPTPVTAYTRGRTRSRARMAEKSSGTRGHAKKPSKPEWTTPPMNTPVFDKWARDASPKRTHTRPQRPPQARHHRR